MEIIRVNKYRLYPSAKQKQILHEYFGASRFVFNDVLGKIQKGHFGTKLHKNKVINLIPPQTKLINELTNTKNEHPFLKKRANDLMQSTLSDLYKGCQNFYRGNGFPKFKSRKNKHQSFEMKAGSRIQIKENQIILPKPQKSDWKTDDLTIKFKKHKSNHQLPEKLIKYTVSKDNLNQYWISFTYKIEISEKIQPKKMKSVGIDLGIKDLIITSDGLTLGNSKLTQKSQKKIKFLNKSLSRKKKFSKNWRKSSTKLAKAHKNIGNQRNHRNHLISKKLVDLYDFIGMESLQVKKMMQNRKLSKSIADVSWFDLFSKIKYKMTEKQGHVIQIDSFYPSSKTCSNCGCIKEMPLQIREYHCPDCNMSKDRDENAAINIKRESLRIFQENI